MYCTYCNTIVQKQKQRHNDTNQLTVINYIRPVARGGSMSSYEPPSRLLKIITIILNSLHIFRAKLHCYVISFLVSVMHAAVWISFPAVYVYICT